MNFYELIQENKDAFVEDLRGLVECISVRSEPEENAPFGPGVRKALDKFLEYGKRDGFETEDIDGYAGVVKLGEGDECFGILAHLDTVPLGKGWKHDKEKMTIEGDILYGRGVLDDKGPLLAAYYALKMVRDAGIELDKEVRLIAGTDEESGMGCMDYYVKHARIPDSGFTPDAEFPAIYAEKGHVLIRLESQADTIIESFETDPQVNVVISDAQATLKTDQTFDTLYDFFCGCSSIQGEQRLENGKTNLVAKGKAAHASLPFLGVNSGVALLNYIGQAYDDTLSKDFHSLLKDWAGYPLGIYTEMSRMGILTVNPGRIRVADGKTEVWLDIRFPDSIDIDTLFEAVCKSVEQMKTPIKAVLERSENPLFVDPDGELIQDLMQAYRDYTGDTDSKPLAVGGGTYAKKFDNFVAFGAERPHPEREIQPNGCHEADEGIYLQDLLEAAAIYADAIVRVAGRK